MKLNYLQKNQVCIYLTISESFDCFTREDIVKELRTYKSIADSLKLSLFVVRNSNGSTKELSILEDIFDRLVLIDSLLLSAFEPKTAMENLEVIICGIKDLQNRKFVYIFMTI
jgi:hypothetical protein